ncbi:MAG: glycosyltransferase family 2 protein [Dehalococcoidia bacterium]
MAILTVNTDGGSFIAQFAESLSQVCYPNWQLVVVDNASTDGSRETIERTHPDAVVLRNDTNLGFTGACNRGLKYCLSNGFDYVLFQNSDAQMEPDFLDHLVAAVDERTMAAPMTYLYHSPGRLDDSVGDFDWTRGIWKHRILGKAPGPEFQRRRPVGNANLSCLLVHTDILRHVGLLDDTFFLYYDDTDFIRRARDRGYRLWFVPESVIYHRKGATIGGQTTAFGLYYLTRNRPYLIQKHTRSRVRRALFWAYFLPTRAVRQPLHLLRGRRDLASAIALGLRDYWRGRMGKTVERNHWASSVPVADPGLKLPEERLPEV